MQVVKLVHNPTAGDETHSKEVLAAAIEAAGFECRYCSTKEEGWKEINDDINLVVVAGGDGTVRKTVKQMLKQKRATIPIGLIALGTANNIAKAFGATNDTEKMVQSLKSGKVKKIDTGTVKNVPDVNFFLEGMGFGIFPYLIKEMKKAAVEYPNPEEELQAALKRLHKILLSYKPRHCQLEIDGTDHSGQFYMVEVMNIRSIGPNMVLAPLANPGDGEFEVVLVPEAHKDKFSEFLLHKLTGGEDTYQFHTLKGKKISIRWNGTRLHVDDVMLKLEKETEVCIEINEGVLQFLEPQHESANG